MRTDILVIGAGVYGISLANYLASQKKSFIIIGEFMDLWRNHTFKDMTLRSDFKLSEIGHPQNKFSCENYFKEVPGQESYAHQHLPAAIFCQYLNWVENHLEYNITTDLVTNLDLDSNPGFVAMLKSGKTIHARKVVIATGFSHHAGIPGEFQFASTKVIHSYNTLEIAKIKNLKVLVIGAGQSAAECIDTLIRGGNHVEWYRRHPPVFFEQPVNIPPWIFNLLIQSVRVFRYLPALVRKAVNRLVSAPTIIPAYRKILDGLTAYDSPPESGSYDCIISATGFQVNTTNLVFLSQRLIKTLNGKFSTPRLSHRFESSVESLYFCGPITEAFFGPAVKFIVGSHYTAAQISKYI